MKSAGFVTVVLSVFLFIFEQISGFMLSGWVAEALCGERYLKEANGVLTDQACGFDADMQLVALCVFGVVVGLMLLGYTYIRTNRRNRRSL